MDCQPESSAGTGVRNGESGVDDEPWCLAGESQEPDSLSDIEASVLELCASSQDDAPRASDGLPSLDSARDLGKFLQGEEDDTLVGVTDDGGVRELGDANGADRSKFVHGFVCAWSCLQDQSLTYFRMHAGVLGESKEIPSFAEEDTNESMPVNEEGGVRRYVPDTYDDSMPVNEDGSVRRYIPDTFEDSTIGSVRYIP